MNKNKFNFSGGKKNKQAGNTKILKNNGLSRNKKELPTIKDILPTPERRMSRRLSNLPPKDIKMEIKEEYLNSPNELKLLDLVSNTHNIKSKKIITKKIIENTDMDYLPLAKDSYKVNTSLEQNELQQNITPTDDNIQKSNSSVKHPKQSELMMDMLSINKHNKLKNNQILSTPENIYLTRQRQKIINNTNQNLYIGKKKPTENTGMLKNNRLSGNKKVLSCIKDESHKTKDNWSECTSERRMSRRLSHLPAIDIKMEIKEQNLSSSYELKLLDVVPKTHNIKSKQIIENTNLNYLPHEEDSCQVINTSLDEKIPLNEVHEETLIIGHPPKINSEIMTKDVSLICSKVSETEKTLSQHEKHEDSYIVLNTSLEQKGLHQNITRTDNNIQKSNSCVKHPKQSELMMDMLSINKHNKLKNNQILSTPENIYFTRQRQKIINNTNQNLYIGKKKPTENTVMLKNNRLSGNKKVLSCIKDESHKTKDNWSECTSERRMSRRLSHLPAIDIKMEIKEQNLSSSYELKLLDVVPKTHNIKSKQIIKNTNLDYLPHEEDSCRVINTSLDKKIPLNEVHEETLIIGHPPKINSETMTKDAPLICSKVSETEKTLSQHETYFDIIKTDKSLRKDTSLLEGKNSGIAETEKSQHEIEDALNIEEYSRTVMLKENHKETLVNCQGAKINSELVTKGAPLICSKVSETEKTLSQYETHEDSYIVLNTSLEQKELHQNITPTDNNILKSNSCVKHPKQSELMMDMLSINKHNKLKNNQILSTPENIYLTRQRQKIINNTNQNLYIRKKRPTENTGMLKNNRLSGNKKELSCIKDESHKTKDNWSECTSERRMSRRLSHLPAIDIKMEIKEQNLSSSYELKLLDVVPKTHNIKSKQIIENTNLNYLPHEKDSCQVINTSLDEKIPLNEVHEETLIIGHPPKINSEIMTKDVSLICSKVSETEKTLSQHEKHEDSYIVLNTSLEQKELHQNITRTDNNIQKSNSCVKHPKQSELMMDMLSINKHNKLKNNQILSTPENIYFTRQRQKIINNTNQNLYIGKKKPTENTVMLKNKRLSGNKKVLSCIKDESHKTKDNWSECTSERRMSRRLSHLPAIDIKMEIKEQNLSSSYELKLLDVVPKTHNIKSKQIIENTNLDYLPHEEDSCRVINTSLDKKIPLNEVHEETLIIGHPPKINSETMTKDAPLICSKVSETEKTLSQHETHFDIIKTDKSLRKDTSLLEGKHSGIAETEKSQHEIEDALNIEEYNRTVMLKENHEETLINGHEPIINSETMTKDAPLICSKVSETEKTLSQHETHFDIIKTDKSLRKDTSLLEGKHSGIAETEKSQHEIEDALNIEEYNRTVMLKENHEETLINGHEPIINFEITTKDAPFICSKVSETEKTLSQHETHFDMIKTEKSLCKDTSLLEGKPPGITETEKSQHEIEDALNIEEDNRTVMLKENHEETLIIGHPPKINSEIMTKDVSLICSKVSETEKTLSQHEKHEDSYIVLNTSLEQKELHQNITRTDNNIQKSNSCVKHPKQSELMMDMLSINKHNKLKNSQILSTPENIYFTRQRQKIINNTNQNLYIGKKKPTENTVMLKNKRLSGNKKVLSCIKDESHKTKDNWSECTSERRMSRRLSHLPAIDIKMEIKEQNLSSSYELKLLDVVPKTHNIKSKQIIENTNLDYLPHEEDSCRVINTSLDKKIPLNEVHEETLIIGHPPKINSETMTKDAPLICSKVSETEKTLSQHETHFDIIKTDKSLRKDTSLLEGKHSGIAETEKSQHEIEDALNIEEYNRTVMLKENHEETLINGHEPIINSETMTKDAPLICSKVSETEKTLSQHETHFDIIKTDKSLRKDTSLLEGKHSGIAETEKSQHEIEDALNIEEYNRTVMLKENHEETLINGHEPIINFEITTKDAPFICSKVSETEKTLSLHKTHFDMIKTEKSLCKDTSLLEGKLPGITETEKSQHEIEDALNIEEYNRTVMLKENHEETFINGHEPKINFEITTKDAPFICSKVSETEKTLSQHETHFDMIKTEKSLCKDTSLLEGKPPGITETEKSQHEIEDALNIEEYNRTVMLKEIHEETLINGHEPIINFEITTKDAPFICSKVSQTEKTPSQHDTHFDMIKTEKSLCKDTSLLEGKPPGITETEKSQHEIEDALNIEEDNRTVMLKENHEETLINGHEPIINFEITTKDSPFICSKVSQTEKTPSQHDTHFDMIKTEKSLCKDTSLLEGKPPGITETEKSQHEIEDALNIEEYSRTVMLKENHEESLINGHEPIINFEITTKDAPFICSKVSQTEKTLSQHETHFDMIKTEKSLCKDTSLLEGKPPGITETEKSQHEIEDALNIEEDNRTVMLKENHEETLINGHEPIINFEITTKDAPFICSKVSEAEKTLSQHETHFDMIKTEKSLCKDTSLLEGKPPGITETEKSQHEIEDALNIEEYSRTVMLKENHEETLINGHEPIINFEITTKDASFICSKVSQTEKTLSQHETHFDMIKTEKSLCKDTSLLKGKPPGITETEKSQHEIEDALNIEEDNRTVMLKENHEETLINGHEPIINFEITTKDAPFICSKVSEAEKTLSQHETHFDMIKTDMSLCKDTSLVEGKPPGITETEKSQHEIEDALNIEEYSRTVMLKENHEESLINGHEPKINSEIITKDVPFMCSRVSETEKTLSQHETHFDMIKTEKSLRRDTSLLEGKHSGMTETGKSQYETEDTPNIEEYSRIVMLKENHEETSINGYPPKINSEIMTKDVPFMCSRVSETEKTLSQHETHFDMIKTEKSLRKDTSFLEGRHPGITESEKSQYESEDTINIEEYSRTVMLKENHEEILTNGHEPKINFEIMSKNAPKSCTDISPKNRLSVSNTYSGINLTDKPTFSKINPEQTIKDNQVPLKEYQEITLIDKPTELKNYIKMTGEENNSFSDKLNLLNSVGLFSKRQSGKMKRKKLNLTTSKNNSLHSQILTNGDNSGTVQTYNSTIETEKVKRSFLLAYANGTEYTQNHVVTPVLTPENPSVSSFHPHRKCMDECSKCHEKFNSIGAICHISQIKDPNKQKLCLKNASHLIGPYSCLCVVCLQTIELKAHTKYLQNRTCIVINCEQTVAHFLESEIINKFKNLLRLKGMYFRSWINSIEKLYVCDVHHNQILDFIQCELCGNRTKHKFQVYQSKVQIYQSILINDQVPATVKQDSIICKACHVYFLWQSYRHIKDAPANQQIDYSHHCKTVLRRICEHNKIKFPLCSEKNNKRIIENQIDPQISKKIKQSISDPTATASQSVELITSTAVSQTQQLKDFCNRTGDKVFQNPKTTDVKKLIMPTLINASKLATTEPSPTTVLLKNKQIPPIQSDLDTSNTLTSSSLNNSWLAQTTPEMADVTWMPKNKAFDKLHKVFNLNYKEIAKHLLFVEQSSILGNLRLKNDGIAKQHRLTSSNVSPLLYKSTTSDLNKHCVTSSNSLSQKSTTYINHILRPNPDKLLLNQTLPKIDVDINNGKVKTILNNGVKKRVILNDGCRELDKTRQDKAVQNLNCQKAMINNAEHLTSSPYISAKTTPKCINPLSIVTKSDVSKSSRDNSCQVVSTIAATNTSVNTTTVTASAANTGIISNITPNTVVVTYPMMTTTTNVCRVTPRISTTAANTTTANCVSQQFVKIAPKKINLKETMNSGNFKRLFFMNPKRSKTDSTTQKCVPIYPKLYLPIP